MSAEAGSRERSRLAAATGAGIAGVVLAAGDSRRMGRPKAGLELDGETFLQRIVRTLAGARLAPIVVIAGRDEPAVRTALGDAAAVEIAVNTAPEGGQLSSLKIALGRLRVSAPQVTGALVALVDHPAVCAETIAILVNEARSAIASRKTGIVLPRHRGRRGHPVIFLREVWEELLATPNDQGARAVVRRDAARVREVDVDDRGVLLDIDTPDDLRRLGG